MYKDTYEQLTLEEYVRLGLRRPGPVLVLDQTSICGWTFTAKVPEASTYRRWDYCLETQKPRFQSQVQMGPEERQSEVQGLRQKQEEEISQEEVPEALPYSVHESGKGM